MGGREVEPVERLRRRARPENGCSSSRANRCSSTRPCRASAPSRSMACPVARPTQSFNGALAGPVSNAQSRPSDAAPSDVGDAAQVQHGGRWRPSRRSPAGPHDTTPTAAPPARRHGRRRCGNRAPRRCRSAPSIDAPSPNCLVSPRRPGRGRTGAARSGRGSRSPPPGPGRDPPLRSRNTVTAADCARVSASSALADTFRLRPPRTATPAPALALRASRVKSRVVILEPASTGRLRHRLAVGAQQRRCRCCRRAPSRSSGRRTRGRDAAASASSLEIGRVRCRMQQRQQPADRERDRDRPSSTSQVKASV